jgi:hypothetical protein
VPASDVHCSKLRLECPIDCLGTPRRIRDTPTVNSMVADRGRHSLSYVTKARWVGYIFIVES